jgi:FkbM family methyltransferase
MGSERAGGRLSHRIAADMVRHPMTAVRSITRLSRSRELRLLLWMSWARAAGHDVESDQAQRLYGYEALGRTVDRVEFERDGIRWRTGIDGNVAKSLFVHGGYQSAEIDSVLAWLDRHHGSREPGALVVEVGANIGSTTIPLCQAGFRVLAIEPGAEAFELLEANVERNGLADRAVLVNLAIARTAGRREIAIPDGDSARAEVTIPEGSLGAVGQSWTRAPVETARLADVLASSDIDPASVHLVWSDTQGSESAVIESGSDLWSSGVPLYVEVWPEGLDAHGEQDQFLKLVETSFRSFLPSASLTRHGPSAPSRPISELRDWFASVAAGTESPARRVRHQPSLVPTSPLKGGPFADALLVPFARRA